MHYYAAALTGDGQTFRAGLPGDHVVQLLHFDCGSHPRGPGATPIHRTASRQDDDPCGRRATPLIKASRSVPNLLVNIQNHFRAICFILKDALGDRVSKLTGFVVERRKGGLIPRRATSNVIPPGRFAQSCTRRFTH
jgi:hypothetical protein